VDAPRINRPRISRPGVEELFSDRLSTLSEIQLIGEAPVGACATQVQAF
jgi:hypothetical protein